MKTSIIEILIRKYIKKKMDIENSPRDRDSDRSRTGDSATRFSGDEVYKNDFIRFKLKGLLIDMRQDNPLIKLKEDTIELYCNRTSITREALLKSKRLGAFMVFQYNRSIKNTKTREKLLKIKELCPRLIDFVNNTNIVEIFKVQPDKIYSDFELNRRVKYIYERLDIPGRKLNFVHHDLKYLDKPRIKEENGVIIIDPLSSDDEDQLVDNNHTTAVEKQKIEHVEPLNANEINMSKKYSKCSICKTNIDNEVELGKFIISDGLTVHYYCILTATMLPQGMDLDATQQTFLGFLPNDISKFIKLIARKQCRYCRKPYAAIRCNERSCRKTFHLPCGINKNCLTEFVGDYNSYCHEHNPIKHETEHSPETFCYMCYEHMGQYNLSTSIFANCCKAGWMHRKCLQKMALTAGYEFKCPYCAVVDFRETIKKFGIFVPDKDAAWYNKEDSIAKDIRCDNKNCICPKGPKFIDDDEYIIFSCDSCGNGIHRICGNKTINDDSDYECSDCPEAANDSLAEDKNCTTLNCKCPNGRNFSDDNDYMLFSCNSCGCNGTHKICGNVSDDSKYECSVCAVVVNKNKAHPITGNNNIITDSNNNLNKNNIMVISLISEDSDMDTDIDAFDMPKPMYIFRNE